ncbi:MAG: RDD family protein [Sphingomonas sp.]
MRRSFVTPEGVDLRLELGGAGERAAAFMIDAAIMLGMLIIVSIVTALIAHELKDDSTGDALAVIWLLGFFVLRNFWFTLFEIGRRGATPGKRLLNLRVVARDGARLTGGAVIVRNAMREIEVFLPLTFLAGNRVQDGADSFMTLFMLAWVGVFMLFPLFNRDRLRVGELLAGTWVVHNVRATLAADLAAQPTVARRHFPEAALALYGVYELQTLEDVLRRENPDAITTVAASIRRKAGLPDDGDDWGFLYDYYAALCARLERDVMLGRRREDKHAALR